MRPVRSNAHAARAPRISAPFARAARSFPRTRDGFAVIASFFSNAAHGRGRS